jgi:3-hydroxyisobutyrate dehydrogenase-like beta-hydroxyacid dehydrogenase
MHIETLGFIGLGVMGGAMCANLVRRSGRTVVVYDAVPMALDKAAQSGAVPVGGISEVAAQADVVFLSLPSIVEVEDVVGELIAGVDRPSVIVDMSTSDVTRTRALGEVTAAAGVTLIDAPVARLRQAAIDGTLLITVGADEEHFAVVEPFLATMGSDVVHAGALGSGQVIKIINNMVVFQNINALAEAMAIGRAAGVDGRTLFETLQLGSADSFQLRNAAMDSLVTDEFAPKRFPTTYAIKDLNLALALADQAGIDLAGAKQTMQLLQRTKDAGYEEEYYPVMIKLIENRA